MTETHESESAQEVDLDHILSDEYQPEYDEGYSEDSAEDEMMGALTPEEKEVFKSLQQKMMTQDPIMEFYEQLQEKPNQEQIDSWKEAVGDVYFAQISEKEYFVFRAIKRKEWRDLLKRLEQVKDPMKQDEAIVMKGVLYPKLDNLKINALSAGTINTMKELVMQASNFFPPEYALQLVRKL
jgi:CRISPR/Cas system CSM-associated protein Csm2 small subunit